MATTEKKRLRRNDVIFIAILVAVIAIAGVCLYLFRGEGNAVTVSVDGKVIATYPLDEDRTEDIPTGEDGLNRLIIKDGKVMMMLDRLTPEENGTADTDKPNYSYELREPGSGFNPNLTTYSSLLELLGSFAGDEVVAAGNELGEDPITYSSTSEVITSIASRAVFERCRAR